MSDKEAQEYLNSFINYEYYLQKLSPGSFHLNRIRALLNLLGNPQETLNFIHIAGSKGKGSTASLTANILKEAGYRAGLYTSPHFFSLNERIRLLSLTKQGSGRREMFSDSISDKKLNVILQKIKPCLEKMRSTRKWGDLTFFEVLTALAIFYFFEEKVDWVVLETGLGGRLDATNVVSAKVCALTPISLEHTQILGGTLAKIAVEKAAIIKNEDSKVVVAPQGKEVRRVIEKRCKEFKIKPMWVGKEIQYQLKSRSLQEQIFDIVDFNQGERYCDLKLSLLGDHQLVNASTAVGIILSLKASGVKIQQEAVYRGLKNNFWPGRFEIVKQNPCVILDGAHNGASAKSLVETIRAFFPKKKVIVVLGVSLDKNKKDIADELNKIGSLIILTKADHPRAGMWASKEVQEYFPAKRFSVTETVSQAVKLAYAQTKKEDIILITGSLFVAAEARKYIEKIKI